MTLTYICENDSRKHLHWLLSSPFLLQFQHLLFEWYSRNFFFIIFISQTKDTFDKSMDKCFLASSTTIVLRFEPRANRFWSIPSKMRLEHPPPHHRPRPLNKTQNGSQISPWEISPPIYDPVEHQCCNFFTKIICS